MKKTILVTLIMLLSISVTQAQKTEVKKGKKDKLYVKVKDGKSPVIYVDGKKFNFPMELIDQSKIKSVHVLKNEEAIKKYNAPNGVILIETKASKNKNISEIKIKGDTNLKPKIIIDGKVSDKKTLDKLKPNQIEKMEIVKGEKAIKKYNAPNGVILITTKK